MSATPELIALIECPNCHSVIQRTLRYVRSAAARAGRAASLGGCDQDDPVSRAVGAGAALDLPLPRKDVLGPYAGDLDEAAVGQLEQHRRIPGHAAEGLGELVQREPAHGRRIALMPETPAAWRRPRARCAGQ